jgi:hypothetical protein
VQLDLLELEFLQRSLQRKWHVEDVWQLRCLPEAVLAALLGVLSL